MTKSVTSSSTTQKNKLLPTPPQSVVICFCSSYSVPRRGLWVYCAPLRHWKHYSYLTSFHDTNASTFHIILCQELIQRHEVDKNRFTFDDFGIEEDEKLYRDYAPSNFNRIEIFYIILVTHAGKEYDMKYKHNCAYSNYNGVRNRDQ